MNLLQSKRSVALGFAALIGAAVVLMVVLSNNQASSDPVKEATYSVLAQGIGSARASVPERIQPLVSLAETQKGGAGKISEMGLASTDSDQVLVGRSETDICVFSVEAGISGCQNQGQASAGQLFVAAPSGCGKYNVIGLMPDGVSELKSDSTGNQKVGTVPVTSNVYSVTLEANQTKLTSRDGSISVDLPLDAYAKDNDAC